VPKPSEAQRYGTTIKGVCAAFEITLAANSVPSEKITRIVALLGYEIHSCQAKICLVSS